MKGIFHWLSMNLPGRPASENEECGGQDDDDPGKPVNIDNLMPDIYDQPLADTEPYLKIVKGPLQASDKSTGFDPYDTARFRKE